VARLLIYQYFRIILWEFLKSIKPAVAATSAAAITLYLLKVLQPAKTAAVPAYRTSLAQTVGITKDAK
jgi:hypothetical protein